MKSILGIALVVCLIFLTSCDQSMNPNSTTTTAKQTVEKPVFNLAQGQYFGNQAIVITSSTDGAMIKYTLDGTQPSENNGTVYTQSVVITETATLKAIAFKADFNTSDVNSAMYSIIVWKGELAAVPLSPLAGWAYYNTTDKKSYIYDGTTWNILAKDGASGSNGTNGSDGKDGVSIVWKGELATVPADPQNGWAYYNTTDKKSYIYDGIKWNILAKDGTSSTDKGEIVVKMDNRIIPDGSSDVDVGMVNYGEIKDIPFVIENIGGGFLSLIGNHDKVFISGDKEFSLVKDVTVDLVLPEAKAIFYVRYIPSNPDGGDTNSCTVTIPNTDMSKSSYKFTLKAKCSIKPEMQLRIGNWVKESTSVYFEGATISTGTTTTTICPTTTTISTNQTDFLITTTTLPQNPVVVNGTSNYDIGLKCYPGFSKDIVFTVTNIGKGNLKFDSSTDIIKVTGTGFTLKQDLKGAYNLWMTYSDNVWYGNYNSGTVSRTIPMGLHKTFVISFKPSAAGNYSATVTISKNNGMSGTFTFTIKGVGETMPANNYFQMVNVTGGTFTQATSTGFEHTITSFNMGKYEVTANEYLLVREWGLSNGYDFMSGQAGNGYITVRDMNYPVCGVSWYDAEKWCNALSEMKGLTPCYYTDEAQTVVYRSGYTDIRSSMVKWSSNGYRLPTEGEWEYAARYIDGTNWTPSDYLSGATAGSSNMTASSEVAVFNAISTAVVGTKKANALGIYDMSGNAAELCWDWYDYDYPTTAVTDYRGSNSGNRRIQKGGNWGYGSDSATAGTKSYKEFNYTEQYQGFRIVKK